MQAIITKLLPATNHRPTRVKATASAGGITVSYDYGEGDPHEQAALALCRKLGWEGSLVSGTTHKGNTVWVFVHDADTVYASGSEVSHASSTLAKEQPK